MKTYCKTCGARHNIVEGSIEYGETGRAYLVGKCSKCNSDVSIYVTENTISKMVIKEGLYED